jgi:hypothetical protein
MSVSDYSRKNRVISQVEASGLRDLAIRQGRDIVLSDPVEDEIWARSSRSGVRPSNYFDYFFTGQDIQVRFAELPDVDLPMIQFAFSIEQEKQPVYGYWDYTYAAVMRGTRLVSGAFTIATLYPDYLKELIAAAAENRSQKNQMDNQSYHRALTQDDKLIEQYWGNNLLDAGMGASGQHVFSVHPPFNFIVVYGVQPVSVPDDATNYQSFYSNHYNDRDNVMLTDDNHRLVESDPLYQNRIIIDAVEIKACQRSYDPDGALCAETYSFFARDAVVPPLPEQAGGHRIAY